MNLYRHLHQAEVFALRVQRRVPALLDAVQLTDWSDAADNAVRMEQDISELVELLDKLLGRAKEEAA